MEGNYPSFRGEEPIVHGEVEQPWMQDPADTVSCEATDTLFFFLPVSPTTANPLSLGGDRRILGLE